MINTNYSTVIYIFIKYHRKYYKDKYLNNCYYFELELPNNILSQALLKSLLNDKVINKNVYNQSVYKNNI